MKLCFNLWGYQIQEKLKEIVVKELEKEGKL